MSRASQNIWGFKRFRISYQPEYPADPAGLVLLSRQLQNQDNSRYTDLKMLKLRHRWMKQQESIHGEENLVCYICGKEHLSPWTKKKNKLATLDHVIPIAKAHNRWNDPTNFQIACFTCNSLKRDT
jgi:5-methylcytosine-specific restriction endonuclease McrA